jgi:hypothetical protein
MGYMVISGNLHGPRRIGRWNQVCLPRVIAREAMIEPRSNVEVVPVADTPGVLLVRPVTTRPSRGQVRRVTSVGQVVLPAQALQHLGKARGDELYVGMTACRDGLLVVSPDILEKLAA